MESLELIKILNADLLMARLNFGIIYPDLLIPDEVYDSFLDQYKLDEDGMNFLAMIDNYLHINHPMRDHYLNLLVTMLSEKSPDSHLLSQQWGLRTKEEDIVWEKSCAIYSEMKLITCLVAALRAAYYSYFIGKVNSDPDFVNKLAASKFPTISVNGDESNLIYIKYLYGELKDYWAVRLLPHDEEQLKNIYNMASVDWDMCIGKSFKEEYITGPFGTISFEESKVIKFKSH